MPRSVKLTCAGCDYFHADPADAKNGWCYVEPMALGVPRQKPACRHYLAQGRQRPGEVSIRFAELKPQQEAQLPAIARELRRDA